MTMPTIDESTLREEKLKIVDVYIENDEIYTISIPYFTMN